MCRIRFSSDSVGTMFFHFLGILLGAMMILLMCNASAIAQTKRIEVATPAPPGADTHNQKNDSGTEARKSGSRHYNSKKTAENTELADTAIDKSYQHSKMSYYEFVQRNNELNQKLSYSVNEHYIWALANRRKIIEQRQVTGNIIFAVVILMVLSGLLFSAVQFYTTLKSIQKKHKFADTSFKASLGGIEVSSSILGVIVLTISLAFFYLYLHSVYPIVSVDQINLLQPGDPLLLK